MIKLIRARVATQRSVAVCESLADEASESEKDGARVSILDEWSKAFLFDEYSANPATNAVSAVTIRQPGDWQELVKTFSRVTKPRPDVQWSIATGAFDDRIVETFRQVKYGLTNSGKSFFSFTLLELKGTNEPFLAAVCQCIGGGVGAVYNNRRHMDAITSNPPSASAPTISPLPAPSPPKFCCWISYHRHPGRRHLHLHHRCRHHASSHLRQLGPRRQRWYCTLASAFS